MPGWFGALIYYHTGDFMNLLKLVLECPVECGRWGQILFGQCPNAEYMNPFGSSLMLTIRGWRGLGSPLPFVKKLHKSAIWIIQKIIRYPLFACKNRIINYAQYT